MALRRPWRLSSHLSASAWSNRMLHPDRGPRLEAPPGTRRMPAPRLRRERSASLQFLLGGYRPALPHEHQRAGGFGHAAARLVADADMGAVFCLDIHGVGG